MALIKCPECGRDNVSDTAKACPNCGFQISAHYKTQSTNIKSYKINKKRFIVIGTILVVVWAIYFFPTRCKHDSCYKKRASNSIFCSYHQAKLDALLSYSYGGYSGDSNKTDASSIFRNLKITNFSASPGTHGGRMQCQVENNNSFTVSGYFYVNFYGSSGNLLYNQLMPLPDVGAGETVSCSTSIPKSDYPNGYDYADFSQASLTKKD